MAVTNNAPDIQNVLLIVQKQFHNLCNILGVNLFFSLSVSTIKETSEKHSCDITACQNLILSFPSFYCCCLLCVCVCRKIKRCVRWKPEPRRLLTEEEYQKQGEEETRRALEELRKQCNSPEFSPWKVVSRLQSPKRWTQQCFSPKS